MNRIREFSRAFFRILFALMRVRCDKPQLSAAGIKMVPEVIRDRLVGIRCTRTLFHEGEHEGIANDGTPERWQ